MSSSAILTIGLVLAVGVRAQSPIWGQCGGFGWTGTTTCVSGSVCTALNPWWFQCLPGEATPNVSFWFSFGDSYTQTAFNPSSTPPQIGEPLGNPPYPGGTTTGGPNWIDFKTTAYNESLILTWNYAYGGATIDASLAPPYTPTVLSLTDQVNEFLNGTATKPASAPWTRANSLFSIWIGINDLSWSWWQTGNRDAYDDTLLDAEFALVRKLYNVGARNFLFINVPPVERSPYFMSLDPNNQTAPILHALIQDFNTKLAQRAQDLEANLTDVTTFLWDSNTDFNTILDDPAGYGFKDATSFGSGANLFWGNDGGQGLHPSSAAHNFFAFDVTKVLEGTIW